MARTRTIKPGFFRSESLKDCSVEARLTFAGLWTEADDEGRGDATPRLLATALWPWDDPTDDMVRGWLHELADTGHIVLYQHRNKRLYQIINWSDHQSAAYRRGVSTLPAPPEDAPADAVPHTSAQPVVQESAEVCLSRAEWSGLDVSGAAAACDPGDDDTTDVAAAALALLIDHKMVADAPRKPAAYRRALERDLPDEHGAFIGRYIARHPTCSALDLAYAIGLPRPAEEPPPEPEWHYDPACFDHGADGRVTMPDGGAGTPVRCACAQREPYPEPPHAAVIQLYKGGAA